MKPRTKAIHATKPDPLTGAISTPIYQTSTFQQESPGVNRGFDYSRSNNPTRETIEQTIATLEEGARGIAFSSGLAAVDAVLRTLSAGDHIIAVDDIYGGTYRLLHTVYDRYDVELSQVDTSDLIEVQNAIKANTKLLWIESPTNPTLKISDIEELCKLAHANGLLVVVDNTFCSPASQRPIELGADIVVHSATKYLSGHSDVIAGLVVTKSESLGEQIKYIQNASGAVLGPFDSWLTLRGIQTLHLRVREHAKNAQKVAEALARNPLVDNVYYPGLVTHIGHGIARKQQTYSGGIISFTLKEDTIDAAESVVCSTQLFILAESLGGVKSLLCHPASMTHASLSQDARNAAGISDSLIRLSVGLEDAEDLITDIEQAVAAAHKTLVVK